ncbi:MAG: hypothetical protein U0894_07780 [Pirellulales bacterium]
MSSRIVSEVSDFMLVGPRLAGRRADWPIMSGFPLGRWRFERFLQDANEVKAVIATERRFVKAGPAVEHELVAMDKLLYVWLVGGFRSLSGDRANAVVGGV